MECEVWQYSFRTFETVSYQLFICFLHLLDLFRSRNWMNLHVNSNLILIVTYSPFIYLWREVHIPVVIIWMNTVPPPQLSYWTLNFSYISFKLVYLSLGKSKEAEIKRINKELANIRSKFKGDRTLDGYQKKKYVCKLLFIFLLGHDIDFGHMEAVNLLSSNKYSEKQIVSLLYRMSRWWKRVLIIVFLQGYLFISVLVNTNSDLIKLIIQSIKNDLASRYGILNHSCSVSLFFKIISGYFKSISSLSFGIVL